MSTDPRVALQALVSSLEEHLSAVASRRGAQDPSVEAAFFAIADAFEEYEDALYEAYGEVTPLELYEDNEEELEDDAEDDAGSGAGFGAEADGGPAGSSVGDGGDGARRSALGLVEVDEN
ncbi:hypothetical protein NCCP1664_05770 [Zafaria cholistanensis]|uniref:Dehydrogenase n=1 Tax=Zafaria cholistanensis TaxID=1682741 RepID=A0A5A7NMS3_9MICC|nr:hypothetical protein NCCP1664_05770 [Zafaria cholistanensis]